MHTLPQVGAQHREGKKMSASVTVEFEDGRIAVWDFNVDGKGAEAVALLVTKFGEATQIRTPLEFNPLTGIADTFIAESDHYSYVVISYEYGKEVRLYQMPADQPLCPVNIERCERFELFTMDDCEMPLGTAFYAAQVWDDAVTGWELGEHHV